MKVISMVPSWTEMLLEAGVNVVGRTRFCVHPSAQVKSIPVVGGTKDLNWDKVRLLNADLLVLDQEENLEWMKTQSPIATVVTHVLSVRDLPAQIDRLSAALGTDSLMPFRKRWEKVPSASRSWNWRDLPGELEVIRRDFAAYDQLVYVIWKNPWMSVSPGTFIGSVLTQLGAGPFLLQSETKYPEILIENFDRRRTYFLFSSEPYPFHRKVGELRNMGIQGSVVDGEVFSWFGSRSLRFLEKV